MPTRAKTPAENVPDFALANHGSPFLLRPLNSSGKNWMNDHLPVDSEETQFWGDAIVIEPRYVSPVVDGITSAGCVGRHE
jgi:hypothetical protein